VTEKPSRSGEGVVQRLRAAHLASVPRAPARPHLVCRVDEAAAEDLLISLEAIALKCGLDNSNPQLPMIMAALDAPRRVQGASEQPGAAEAVWAQVWTSEFGRTPYAVWIESFADADEQLDCLSQALRRPRGSWTIKPPRGWMDYGMPLGNPPHNR